MPLRYRCILVIPYVSMPKGIHISFYFVPPFRFWPSFFSVWKGIVSILLVFLPIYHFPSSSRGVRVESFHIFVLYPIFDDPVSSLVLVFLIISLFLILKMLLSMTLFIIGHSVYDSFRYLYKFSVCTLIKTHF